MNFWIMMDHHYDPSAGWGSQIIPQQLFFYAGSSLCFVNATEIIWSRVGCPTSRRSTTFCSHSSNSPRDCSFCALKSHVMHAWDAMTTWVCTTFQSTYIAKCKALSTCERDLRSTWFKSNALIESHDSHRPSRSLNVSKSECVNKLVSIHLMRSPWSLMSARTI